MQKFSCYDGPLGQLRRKPGLGTPLPLMREIYARSLEFMEQSVGPDYLPQEYVRASVSIDVHTEMAHPSRLSEEKRLNLWEKRRAAGIS